jgi:nucleotide-binding universal stress UspA family protein
MAETIVAGYDGKDGSVRVLDAAIALVRESGAELVVVVDEYLPVDPGMPSMVYDVSGAAVPLPDPDPQMPPPLEPIMDKARDQVDAAGVTAEYVWGAGSPARAIVDAARDRGASKIVIGADHHGLFGRMLGDNVEAEVKREARCEVVVVD